MQRPQRYWVSPRALPGADSSCLLCFVCSVGAAAFLEVFTARLAASHSQGGLPIPFELEVVEAALISRTTRLEAALMEVEPRVAMLLELLPNKLTADALEELRLSKQALVRSRQWTTGNDSRWGAPSLQEAAVGEELLNRTLC